MGFVFEVWYDGSEGFLRAKRGVEGFDVQGSVVRKDRMASSQWSTGGKIFDGAGDALTCQGWSQNFWAGPARPQLNFPGQGIRGPNFM